MMKNRLIGTALLTSTLLGGMGVSAAVAATPTNNHTATTQMSHYHGPNTAALAKQLGVSETKLKAALDAIHKKSPKGDNRAKPSQNAHKGHGKHLAEVAKKLGVTEDKLKSVMKADKPTSKDSKPDFAKIAKDLGVTEAKLKEAFAHNGDHKFGAHKGMHSHNGHFAKELAKALNMDESKVKAALEATRPSNIRGGGHAKDRF